jgi:phenylpropionate dioxygenase-like ring-hydroxylating dioxygenase large terminal subunit
MTAVDHEILDQVMRPVATARGLPNPFYTDPEVFALEQRKVFAPNWCCVGFGKDVPNPGDVKPVSFLGQPLLIARDRQGVIRVFENVCRHRGMILVSEPASCKSVIRCPYHSWCYGLDGALRTTPHVGGVGQNTHAEIRREELGLYAVRSHVWMDVVFVNLSGTAPEFRDHAADLVARCREFESLALHHGGDESSFKLEVGTNWKLAVENYAESYHLPWVHPGLNSYSRLEDHYNMVERSFSGQGSLAYTPGFGPSGERFARFPGLSEKWERGAEYPCFFPNLLLGFQNDHYFAIHLEPVAHDRTIEHVEIYYAGKAMTEPAFAGMRERNARLWKEIFVEDIGVVEGMQRGRRAPRFDGGKFSPVLDAATHRFHAWVAEQIAA